MLSIVVSQYLFEHFTHLPEGELTKIRASLVCEKSLHDFAKQIDLGQHILLGKGEENTGGRQRVSILADAFEAVIAAIYLDGGLESAKKHILRFIPKDIDSRKAVSFSDHLNSNVIGKGIGRSKKEAEQMAAKEALELMGYES